MSHIRTVSAFVTLISFLYLLSAPSLAAKSLDSLKRVDQTGEQFMTQVQDGDVESAYALLSAYAGVNIEGFLARGEKVAQDLKKLEKNVGKPISYAKLKTQNIGEHFYKITYLLKYKTAAVIWELNYYQPEQGWLLVDVAYHADINRLFD